MPQAFKIFWPLLFFLGGFFTFFLPPTDTDLGWHLRYGEYFWQTGKFLTTNQLALLMEDYQWPNSYALYQVITFIIFKSTGFWGLSLLYSFIFLLAFLILYLFWGKNLYQTMMSFLLIVPFSGHVFNLGWRAQAFSFLGLVLVFYLLKPSQTRPKMTSSPRWTSGFGCLLWRLPPARGELFAARRITFFLPILFLLWVNLHGAFVLGLLVFSFYLSIQAVQSVIQRKGWHRLATLSLNFFLSILATLVNPYKTKVWWEAWHHLKIPMKELIAEWVPPTSFIVWSIILSFTFCLLIMVFEKRKTFWQYFLFLSLLMFFYLGLSARRNTPFFLLNTSLIIFDSSFFKKLEKSLNFISLSKVSALFIFFWATFLQFPKSIMANSSWQNYCQARESFAFPCQAVQFLKEKKIKGNFYNAYEWGGFLEWQLPKSKFFVDGRMPAWPTPSGKSPYTIYLETLQTQPGWQKTLEEYKINYLLIENNNALDLELKTHPEKYPWQVIYRDDQAVIYQKIQKSHFSFLGEAKSV